jgi:hypothetical protein
MHITYLPQQEGDLMVKWLISILGVKDQFAQITWVVFNFEMLIEYSLATYLINIG